MLSGRQTIREIGKDNTETRMNSLPSVLCWWADTAPRHLYSLCQRVITDERALVTGNEIPRIVSGP
jgi:hypothetical protein